MNQIYDKVPIISDKDLSYLSDIFSWNYNAYKFNYSAKNAVTDIEIEKKLTKSLDIFLSVMKDILDILNSGGTYE